MYFCHDHQLFSIFFKRVGDPKSNSDLLPYFINQPLFMVEETRGYMKHRKNNKATPQRTTVTSSKLARSRTNNKKNIIAKTQSKNRTSK